jgi:hypothetical protein
MYATDVAPPLYRSWRMNQNPMKTQAGIGATRIKIKDGTTLTILARGKNTRYAPKIPDMAAEAPMAGM